LMIYLNDDGVIIPQRNESASKLDISEKSL
jgi:hypothetical protein